MSETVISIILLFNIVLVLLFFIMKSHKRVVDKTREELSAIAGSEQQPAVSESDDAPHPDTSTK